MTASCFYEGTVRHRRTEPAVEFRHPITLAYLDLDELPGLLGGRLVRPGFGPLRFRREDYLGGGSGALDAAVRDVVEERTGRRPGGPIRLLTSLRTFGTLFNPVSFYYVLSPDGTAVEAILAEVTNTPWGERHTYLIPGGGGPATRAQFAKAFHVSPFMGMDHTYDCHATRPEETLSVHIESRHAGERAFDATLALRRREMNRDAVVHHLARYPLAGLRVLALIYWRALRLKLAGAPLFPHPQAGAA